MYYKSISYMISHVFLMLFMYLFISHRYSKTKTACICFSSFLILTMTDCLKLDIFADSSFCYVSVTVFQILVTQFTGILISKHRDSKVLFIGLSASSYVIAGSVSATILFTWTQNMLVSVIGGFSSMLEFWLYYVTGFVISGSGIRRGNPFRDSGYCV